MHLSLVEPLRYLFKDEVRKVGLELGIPADMINRHPFPGPGLAIRILGEVNAERVDLLQKADAIFINGLKKAGLYTQVWQAGTILLPVKSVENMHVNALNAGARQYLKANGKLEGEEISVSGNYYMKGDRVLITGTNKELGVINGDLGEVLHASTDRFVMSVSGGEKTIEFNPSEYDGFRHGYATTIFKAQGASIKDVYVFHDKFSGIRNSYVSLSRHIDELKLYTNRESTIDTKMLVKQLSRDFDKGSSLQYLTEEEIRYRDNVGEAKKTITGKFLVGYRDWETDRKSTRLNSSH